MTSKKQDTTPEQPLTGQPLDVLIEVLATAAGQLEGLKGAELKKHVTELTHRVQQLAQSVEERVVVDEQRRAVAAEVERLIDVFVRTGTTAGNLIDKNREAIAKAFRGVDLDRVAEGLRLFADWMQNPTSQSETQVKQLVEQLQATLGPMVGYDPQREEEQRRAEIKADVKKSLDEIFRPKKPS